MNKRTKKFFEALSGILLWVFLGIMTLAIPFVILDYNLSKELYETVGFLEFEYKVSDDGGKINRPKESKKLVFNLRDGGAVSILRVHSDKVYYKGAMAKLYYSKGAFSKHRYFVRYEFIDGDML